MPPSKSARQRPRSETRRPVEPGYDLSVFINCPFDDGHRPLFHASIFAVCDCGYAPRCALKVLPPHAGAPARQLVAGCADCCNRLLVMPALQAMVLEAEHRYQKYRSDTNQRASRNSPSSNRM